jgi:predicted PurR-regulated permease PerM
MNAEWNDSTKKIAAVMLAIGLVYVIYLSRPVLPFLIIATLIAFLLAPVVSFLNQKCRIPRAVSILLAYLLLLVAMLLLPLILVPAFIEAFSDIQIDVVALIREFLAWLRATLQYYRIIKIFDFSYDLSDVIDPALDLLAGVVPNQALPALTNLINSIPSTLGRTIGVASTVVGSVLSGLLAFILTLLYSVYMSAEGNKFGRSFIKLVPEPHRPEFQELGKQIRRIWSAYFRGQFLLAVLIGSITWIAGTAIGLPGAFALAIIAGVMEVIPNLGPILAAIPAIIVALIQGSSVLEVNNLVFMLIVIGMYVIIQQIENNLIVPRILGQAVELPALVVMAGVVVGASVGGVLGALIAAPTIATGRVIVGYTYAKTLGKDPFPPPDPATTAMRSPRWSARIPSLWRSLVLRLASLAPQNKSTEEDQPKIG